MPRLHHLNNAAGLAPLDIDDADMPSLDWMFAGDTDFSRPAFSQGELGHSPGLPDALSTSHVLHRQGSFDWLETSWNLSGPSAKLTTAMSLLSTYLHLVAIYEALFRHLVVSLSHIPPSSVSSLQTVPDLRVAGFTIQHGGLQIKMLIQVVEHHFETIDGALGLPVRYRVFGGERRMGRDHDRGAGLLGGHEFEALLDAVLGSIGTGSAVGPGFRNILSLRQSIDKVQRYL
ncbi:uncharacterized protein DNG_04584 [Cephalotrichum gorgonifer]|uniref:Uncharacterized protein n=1 Tax=Cephalotrichum gorgonifer TaxID=2041049 RepID=A0AAE8MWD6_9PEZI|nr:uncharacterized protein DNG_04584 [Cephalotrichum gorgonifer]